MGFLVNPIPLGATGLSANMILAVGGSTVRVIPLNEVALNFYNFANSVTNLSAGTYARSYNLASGALWATDGPLFWNGTTDVSTECSTVVANAGTTQATTSQVAAQQIVSSSPIFYGVIDPGSAVTLQFRLNSNTGGLLSPSNASSVSITVTDMLAGTAGAPIAFTPSTVISSALQAWAVDSAGYNVLLDLNGSNFQTAGTTYQIVATIETSFGQLVVVWHVQTNVVQ